MLKANGMQYNLTLVNEGISEKMYVATLGKCNKDEKTSRN